MNKLADYLKRLKEYRITMFNCHSEFLLNTYLEKLFKILSNFKSNKNNPNICVIVEDRINFLLRFSVLNTLLMTKLERHVYIYTTKKAYSECMSMFSDLTNYVSVIQLNFNSIDVNHINVPLYNSLFKTSSFWKGLPTRKVFIFQTDSFLIEPLDDSMFSYDYIGAPFVKGKHLSTSFPEFSQDTLQENHLNWITQIYNPSIPDGLSYGNGGLSIRDRELMIKICENECSSDEENEDIFFSRFLKVYSNNLPPLHIVRRFSCECDYQKSIACHASYLYILPHQQAEIYERHVKYIISLFDFYITSNNIT